MEMRLTFAECKLEHSTQNEPLDLSTPKKASHNGQIFARNVVNKPTLISRSNYTTPFTPKKPIEKGNFLSTHQNTKSFQCQKENCGKSFKSQQNLDYHMDKNVCGKKNQTDCHLCERKFNRHIKLIKHISKEHNGSEARSD